MEKFNILKAVEEEAAKDAVGDKPLSPENFKRVRRASSSLRMHPEETTRVKLEALKRRHKSNNNRATA